MSRAITPTEREMVERVMLNPTVEDALANGLRTTVSRFLSAAPPPEPRADDGVVERHMLSEPDSENPSIEGLIRDLKVHVSYLGQGHFDGAWAAMAEDMEEAADALSRMKGERDEANRQRCLLADRALAEAQRAIEAEALVKELREGLERGTTLLESFGHPGDDLEFIEIRDANRSLLTKGEVEDGLGSARASRDARSSTRPEGPHSDEGGAL